MSERLVNVDRETPMRLPVVLRDWVSKDDMVHFVLEAVETNFVRFPLAYCAIGRMIISGVPRGISHPAAAINEMGMSGSGCLPSTTA